MKNRLWILSFLIFLCSCSQPILKKEIVGDWISKRPFTSLILNDSIIGIGGSGDFYKYSLKNDTILIENEMNSKYVVLDVAKDSMKILDLDWSMTIDYNRIERTVDWDFDSIYFETSGCYGKCESMILRIYKDSSIRFKGRAYTRLKGNYVGKLNASQMKLVDDKIDLLDFRKLKKRYSAGHTDGQTRKLIVYSKDKQGGIKIYGHETEPEEANLVFHYLKNLYKQVALKKVMK